MTMMVIKKFTPRIGRTITKAKFVDDDDDCEN
jgi:hypothetical protein